MKFGSAMATMVKQNLQARTIPALMGESGIGKSSFFVSLAEELGTKSFTLACNLLADKADLTGARMMPNPSDDGGYRMEFFPHEDLAEAIDYAEAHPDETPILLMDEITRTNPDVTSGALGISTDRKIGRRRLPENLCIAVAGNLEGNVSTLDEASLSRFAIYHVKPDADVFMELHDDLNHWIKDVLSERPDLIFCKATPAAIASDDEDENQDDTEESTYSNFFGASEEMSQISTPRTIKNLSDWLNLSEASSPDQLRELLATEISTTRGDSSALNEAVETFIGNTELAALVVNKIAEDIQSSVTPAAGTVSLTKPADYDGLKAATSVTELDQLISQMSATDRSAALIYALSETTDNTRLIEQLAVQVPRIENDDMTRFVDLLRQQQAYRPNVEALTNSSTPAGNSASGIANAFL